MGAACASGALGGWAFGGGAPGDWAFGGGAPGACAFGDGPGTGWSCCASTGVTVVTAATASMPNVAPSALQFKGIMILLTYKPTGPRRPERRER
jgi:hypothetical protein